MQTNFAASSFYEGNEKMEERLPILRAKFFIEVCLMQLAKWLQLEHKTFHDKNLDGTSLMEVYRNKSLSSPDLGGRIILNTQNTARQIAHTDNVFTADIEISAEGCSTYPPYFCMISYNEPVPLWILEGSHRMLDTPDSSMKILGKLFPLRLIYLPPYSVAFIRGDVLHAGAGSEEAKERMCPRFHMYILREGLPLGDTIVDRIGSLFTFRESDKADSVLKRTRKF